MPLVAREHPYPGFNFIVEVPVPTGGAGGKTVKGAFSEVSGLEATKEVIEYRNGNDDIHTRKRPGQTKFANIVLKRGVTGNIEFWKWLVEAMNGNHKPVDGQIHQLDEAKNTVVTWKFKSGWACKFTGPGLNAKNNEVAMETVEICHEGLAIDTDGQQG